MRITAALPWWDEPVDLLEACVRGIGNVADRVVALDGGYRRYPDATPASPPEQAETIMRVAAEVGIEAVVLTPGSLWAGQVEKRSFLVAAASVGSDWLVLVDADHVIRADRASVRRAIEGLGPDVDVVSVAQVVPVHESRPVDDSIATNWHRAIAGSTGRLAHIFRALPGLHAEGFHWTYAAVKDGQRVVLKFGDDFRDDGSRVPHELGADYVVEHRTLLRDELRLRRGRAFCNDRIRVVDLTGQEDDVPGLPSPEWDYETVPY